MTLASVILSKNKASKCTPKAEDIILFYSSLSRRLPDTCISFPSPSLIFPTIPPTLTLIPRHSPPSLRHHPPYLHLHPHHHAHLHLHHLQGRNFRGKMTGAGLVS
ncbi:hypothetical protein NA56DRAFT_328890 [Hyaloscypha hepaticicola]|uniref:Uncharacterized protein n=1 Tax=Hyaloscypha hepaticicola TaxID=2082293 RepID=A0A2J6PNT2_9HELO|nr:hypothetical protein NA56DRAFT_328890 [Hyaloscypha hepaticicola]